MANLKVELATASDVEDVIGIIKICFAPIAEILKRTPSTLEPSSIQNLKARIRANHQIQQVYLLKLQSKVNHKKTKKKTQKNKKIQQ